MVATGNHWVLDIPAGVAIGVVGLLAAGYADRRRGVPAGAEGPEGGRQWSLPERGAS